MLGCIVLVRMHVMFVYIRFPHPRVSRLHPVVPRLDLPICLTWRCPLVYPLLLAHREARPNSVHITATGPATCGRRESHSPGCRGAAMAVCASISPFVSLRWMFSMLCMVAYMHTRSVIFVSLPRSLQPRACLPPLLLAMC